MNNNNAMVFFNKLASDKNNNPQSVKLAHNTDFSNIDAEFILKYADKNSTILDLGSGSGLIVNKIYDKVKSIECIEPFKQFSQYIIKSDNVIINNCNIFNYKPQNQFDIITAFGFMHYFNEEESIEIYKKVKKMLKTLRGGGETELINY